MKGLFGQEVHDPVKQRGHAAIPGSGPEGETCGTCMHRCRRRGSSKVFQKCGLMCHYWTNGYGTDIRCKDPACKMWQAESDLTGGLK